MTHSDATPKCQALVARRAGDGVVTCAVETVGDHDLGDGDVLLRVLWSGINYKDVLASSTNGKVARLDVLVPGIDLAAEVLDPGDSDHQVGDVVVAHGYDLGVSHHGGFSELARVSSEWLVPMPAGLDPREAMLFGTAGYTAALAVSQLQSRGLDSASGPVLVTGASGGVGSIAVGILSNLGHHVVASTGSRHWEPWLAQLGAAEVIGREEVVGDDRPLARERWAGVVDCVGGATLSGALKAVRYGGAVATTGNTGGNALDATVLPFILRGVALLGIDSVNNPIDERRNLWQRMAGDLRPRDLESVADGETGLDGLTVALDRVRSGQVRGRTLVRIAA